MTKEQIRATVLRTTAQIVVEEVLSNLEGDITIGEQMKPGSIGFLEVIMHLRKRHAVEVPEANYVQLAASDSCMACLDPGPEGL